MIILRTYCLIGRDLFGVWLRMHPHFWKVFYMRGPYKGFSFQIGPLNVRIGKSWYVLSGSPDE